MEYKEEKKLNWLIKQGGIVYYNNKDVFFVQVNEQGEDATVKQPKHMKVQLNIEKTYVKSVLPS
jgi:hypothetical protein